MMPGSNYATLEGSMLDIQGVSYVLPGVEAYMYHWLSDRTHGKSYGR